MAEGLGNLLIHGIDMSVINVFHPLQIEVYPSLKDRNALMISPVDTVTQK